MLPCCIDFEADTRPRRAAHAARNFRFGFIVTIQAQPWAICWQNDIISPYGPKKPNTTTFHTRRFAAQQASACPKCARNPRVARRNSTPIGTQPGDKGASPWSLDGPRQSGARRAWHREAAPRLYDLYARPQCEHWRRALGVGAVVVAGAAASAVSNEKKADSEVDALAVNKESVFSISDCTVLDSAPLSLAGEFKMPYGTLVWANSETYAACLLPTESSSPLTQAAVLSLSSGQYTVVLDGPHSSERGFDIYDVRCNDQGIVWIESNCYTGEWRVFQATLSRGVAGDAKQVDSGNGDWDVPSITVAKSRAFWQVMPSTSGNATSEPSALKSAAFGSSDVRVDWESNGRMSTSPYSTGDAICISPRSQTSSSYSQLTLIDAESGAMRESLTLPASMRPLEAAYVNGRFSFTFDSIYTYGEGLASLGTYAPVSNDTGEQWFCFDRNPLCAPAWCGGNLVVKSTRTVAGVNLSTREMFSLDCPDDCDNYGDFLASQGDVDSLVTYLGMSTNEDDAYTLVRVWTA